MTTDTWISGSTIGRRRLRKSTNTRRWALVERAKARERQMYNTSLAWTWPCSYYLYVPQAAVLGAQRTINCATPHAFSKLERAIFVSLIEILKDNFRIVLNSKCACAITFALNLYGAAPRARVLKMLRMCGVNFARQLTSAIVNIWNT